MNHLGQFCHFTDKETETQKRAASSPKSHKTALCLFGVQPDGVYGNYVET